MSSKATNVIPLEQDDRILTFDKGEKFWCWFVMKGILKMVVREMRGAIAIYAFCARLLVGSTWV